MNEEEQFEGLRFKKGTVFYEKKQLEDINAKALLIEVDNRIRLEKILKNINLLINELDNLEQDTVAYIGIVKAIKELCKIV